MLRLKPLGFLIAALTLSALLLAATATDPVRHPVPDPAPAHGQSAFATLSGKELIRKLQVQESRDRASYELWRRATRREHTRTDTDFDEFLESHQNSQLVVCPQGKGRPPIYLVLYEFLSRSNSFTREDYEVTEPDQLFPRTSPAADPHPHRPAIDAFTADGKEITPFGENNVLEGTLADINGDGLVELVEITHYGVDGAEDVAVLHVWAVKPQAQPLLTVLLNWGADEWSYRLSDSTGGAVSQIELGPRTRHGSLLPKAVFRWDGKARAYIGPTGQAGDHFRRLGSGDVWSQLNALHTSGLIFPPDPDFAASAAVEAKAAPPPSRPYRPQPLTELPNADLLRLMGPGRNAYDFERESVVRNHVPADFWTMPSKQAALAIAEANRSAQHRAVHRLAVDDRSPEAPPAVCTLAFSDFSSRCYNAIDAFYFLRVDPNGSHLAYARAWAGGAVFHSIVFNQPAFDLRYCPISYEDARHLAATIWWLDRVRSRDFGQGEGSFGGFSTADGFGTLTLRDGAGATLLDRKTTLWSDALSERWSGNYTHEAFVNFAAYLVTEVLTARLGAAWTEAQPRNDQNSYLRQDRGPLYTAEEIQRHTELANRFLASFTPAQDHVSAAIAACAADAAGTLVMPGAKPLLEKILATLPARLEPRRTYEKISEEYRQVLGSDEPDPSRRAARKQKLQTLDAERDAVLHDSSANSPAHLREVAGIALRKIETADDPAALHAWATAEEAGSQWAMQRLSRLDPPRYVQALEWWMNRKEPRWARQLFEEIGRVDPPRATAIAATLPPEKQEALAVASFSLLQRAGRLTDEKERLATLLAVLLDPRSGWDERGKAIALLVPPEDPFRYPQRDVDDALLRVLEPDMADATINFTLAKACQALALRQRTETFERMAELLGADRNANLYDDILGALVHLAQSDPERFNPRLAALLAPQLQATDKRISEILWAIWATDLREFLPALEHLGTSGPDDYQDAKATTSGGGITPVLGRFHLARQIADTWHANDAVTRIRLLTALASASPHDFAEAYRPERVARLKSELVKSAATLTTAERRRLDEFFQVAAASPLRPDLPNSEHRQKIVTLVQTTIALP